MIHEDFKSVTLKCFEITLKLNFKHSTVIHLSKNCFFDFEMNVRGICKKKNFSVLIFVIFVRSCCCFHIKFSVLINVPILFFSHSDKIHFSTKAHLNTNLIRVVFLWTSSWGKCYLYSHFIMEKKDLHHHTWKPIFFFLNVSFRSAQLAKVFQFSIICQVQFIPTLGSTLMREKRNNNLDYYQ